MQNSENQSEIQVVKSNALTGWACGFAALLGLAGLMVFGELRYRAEQRAAGIPSQILDNSRIEVSENRIKIGSLEIMRDYTETGFYLRATLKEKASKSDQETLSNREAQALRTWLDHRVDALEPKIETRVTVR